MAHGGNSTLLDIRSVMYLAIASYAEGKHREGDKMLHLMRAWWNARAATTNRCYTT